jgi:DNA topoisomerase-1
MKENFSSLVSIDFTAGMEEKLDSVESAETNWVEMLGEFFGPFKDQVDLAEKNIEEMKGILDEETDVVCEKCGRMMMKKLGRFGFFLACSGFPECRNAKSLPLGECPLCSGSVIKRSSPNSRGVFYGCSNYPDCEFISRDTPAEKNCPKCGKLLFAKKTKGRGEEHVCYNPDCGFRIELLDEPASGDSNDDQEG